MFTGIVRGYAGMGMSGMGNVVVEYVKGEVPAAFCFSFTHIELNEEIVPAVLCMGDHRPCRNIAEALKDELVDIDLDDMGLLPVFYRVREVPE